MGDLASTIMTTKLITLLGFFILTGFSLVAGDTIHQRGWIGGEYALAKKAGYFRKQDQVHAFPKELQPEQKAGIFVRSVPTNSPAAQAGLQAGDLILRVNEQKTESLSSFRKVIEKSEPGQSLALAVWNAGETRTVQVTTGRETYRNVGTVGLGIHFSTKIDLVPNPEFSALVIGFDRKEERAELHSTESEFVNEVRRHNGSRDTGHADGEGWNAWLVIFHLGMHKRILSQEI